MVVGQFYKPEDGEEKIYLMSLLSSSYFEKVNNLANYPENELEFLKCYISVCHSQILISWCNLNELLSFSGVLFK